MSDNNTARGNKRVDKLIKSIRQKVASNDLRYRAHNKVNHFTQSELLEFLGEREDRVLVSLALIVTGTVRKTDEFMVEEKFQHRAKSATGIDLYIWEDFQERILDPLRGRKVKLAKNRTLDKLKLSIDRHDTEMQAEVGHKPFKIGEFVPMLWGMLSEQKNGEEGFLLTNDYVNIFHVALEDGSVVAVSVHWDDDKWRLFASPLGYGGRWRDGSCLFVPATL